MLKKEFQGQDVEFLYLGYNCKKDNWEKVIMQEQIDGFHYWLNEAQGNVLKQKFGITGIPHFLLVDKSGKVIKDPPPWPSDKAEIREKLNELLVP